MTFVLRKICITNSKSVLVSLENPKQTKKKNMNTAIPLFYAYGLRNCLVQELILHVETSWNEYLRGENTLKTGYLSQRVVKYYL